MEAEEVAAGMGARLAVEGALVGGYRVKRYVEAVGDLAGAQALGHEGEDLGAGGVWGRGDVASAEEGAAGFYAGGGVDV